jgi:diaminopimelate decarboxylase
MNYNAMFRPAIVFVSEGKARLVRRRETLEDITRRDIV